MSFWPEFLAVFSGIISIYIIIKILHTNGNCLWMNCPVVTRIKPVQVVPLPYDGIPLANEIKLARIV